MQLIRNTTILCSWWSIGTGCPEKLWVFFLEYLQKPSECGPGHLTLSVPSWAEAGTDGQDVCANLNSVTFVIPLRGGKNWESFSLCSSTSLVCAPFLSSFKQNLIFFFYDVNYWESRRASQTILVPLMKLSHFKHLSCKITYLFSFLLQWNFGSEQHCLLINLSPWMIPLQATNLDKVEKVLKWAKAYLIFNSQFRV